MSDVFPRDWKSFNDKRMVKELRRLITTVKSSEEVHHPGPRDTHETRTRHATKRTLYLLAHALT